MILSPGPYSHESEGSEGMSDGKADTSLGSDLRRGSYWQDWQRNDIVLDLFLWHK